ncbi:MAG TPA: hypothetical protein VFZ91_04480 [Allosphingosinicella sp.]
MNRDTCLKRHLLHACVEAYHPDPPVYSGPARWTARPVRIAPGRSPVSFLNLPVPEIDFALAGRFAEGIVVAFRGTLPPLDLSPDGMRIVNPDIAGLAIAFDWGNNLDAPPIRNVALGGATLPGAVHRGFAESLARLWPGVAAAIDRLRSDDPAPRLFFTGHSKGGALANLAAACARQVWPSATVKAATFGAPRAGDPDFAREYAAAGIECHRYEVTGDQVPTVPPGTEPVGALHSLEQVPRPRPPGPVRFVRSLFAGRDDRWILPGVVAAHLPYRHFGYGDNVCEPGCQHDWR